MTDGIRGLQSPQPGCGDRRRFTVELSQYFSVVGQSIDWRFRLEGDFGRGSAHDELRALPKGKR